jgi:transposase
MMELAIPLFKAWEAIRTQLQAVDNGVLDVAAKDATCQRMLTIPGVGTITALAFKTAVDMPWRFQRSEKAGPISA